MCLGLGLLFVQKRTAAVWKAVWMGIALGMAIGMVLLTVGNLVYRYTSTQ